MTRLVGAQLIDANGRRDGTFDLDIAGGRFLSIRSATSEPAPGDIDLRGHFLLPALANLHTHLALDSSIDPFGSLALVTRTEVSRDAKRRWRRSGEHGIGLVRDVGSLYDVDIRLASEQASAKSAGPRIVACGPAITVPHGHGARLGIEIVGPTECRQAARAILARGARALKLIATGGIMSPTKPGAPELSVAEMRAAVEVAHAAGCTVAAHAESDEGISNALDAGVDTIEHGHGLTPDLARRMCEQGTVLVPTMLADIVLAEANPESGISAEVIEKCKAMLPSLIGGFTNALAAGVTVGAGNDAGTPFVTIEDIGRELDLYVRHGMSPLEALASATVAAADLFSLRSWGTFDEGAEANFAAFERNPLEVGFGSTTPACAMLGGTWTRRLVSAGPGPVVG
jgi:imidazolonepropionase-like amidohydrolase